MPRLTQQDGMEQVHGNNFQFSAAKMKRLVGASEYTLATIATDVSYSLDGHEKDIELMLKTAAEACQDSARHDSLLLRHLSFSDTVDEGHGFTLLADLKTDQYDGVIKIRSNTALNEATFNAIEATRLRGKQLLDAGYNCNGIVFVITDGMNNIHNVSAAQIRDAIKQVKQTESLESLVTILIGINVKDPMVKDALDNFAKDTGMTHFIAMEDVSRKSLAKLGGFISQSISSTSQALGSGGPSKALSGNSLTI
jgi:hypothetical protein